MKALEVVRKLAGGLAEQRLTTRVTKMSTDRLIDWAESTVPAIGKALGDWTQQGAQEGLEEARLGAASLLVVLEELERRRVVGRL